MRPLCRRLLPCLLLPLALATGARAETKRALLTIDGLNLGPNEYVASFRISTWNVNVLAECRMPTSWKMEVEKLQEPEGLVTARPDVHGERLRELGQLFLVELSDGGVPPSPHPASFSGSINLVSTDADAKRVHRKLKPENFHLVDAQGCPTPPPASAR